MKRSTPSIEVFARQLGVDIETYAELLELFVEVGTTDLEQLQAAVAEHDREQAITSAHSLKGAACQIGLQLFSEGARELEGWADSADNADWNGLAAGTRRLQQRFARIAGLLVR